MKPYKLSLQAAMRRYAQSQSSSNIQNATVPVSAEANRMSPVAEIGKFQQFNAETGEYVFTSNTQSISIPASQILSNGGLRKGQKVLLAQGTADFLPA
jgi:hypothetical protein